ncbi:MAG: hypothetical protein QOJ99_329, partial [Bryobacterales bacterium]|nr:hypothetical protein [Bryobacterales bacterium]
MIESRIGKAILALVLPWTAFAQTSPSANSVLFTKRILPTLQKNCAACHAADNPSGGLTLADFDAVLVGGKHGAAITPGSARESLLVQYVRGEKTPRMPMGGALSEDVIASLVKAIDEMQPLPKSAKRRDPYLDWLLTRPAAQPSPAVHDVNWPKNPVDAFVLARLEQKGLKPAPAASKRALLRRVYFDLIGLPPTPSEI